MLFRSGLGPIIWDSWQQIWTGTTSNTSSGASRTVISGAVEYTGGAYAQIAAYGTEVTQVIQDTILNSYKTGYETRTGTQTKVTESFTKESVGDKLVSKELIPFMRSRNVEFNSQKLKPLTQVYAFFDGVNVTKYCTPKLLEILMSSGTFQVGETVIGSIISTGLQQLNVTENPFIKFRVAQANHQEGPYDAPTKIYKNNPYLSQVSATNLETYEIGRAHV